MKATEKRNASGDDLTRLIAMANKTTKNTFNTMSLPETQARSGELGLLIMNKKKITNVQSIAVYHLSMAVEAILVTCMHAYIAHALVNMPTHSKHRKKYVLKLVY